MISGLGKRGADIEKVARKAAKDKKLLSEIIKGTSSEETAVKYNCAKVLRYLSENNPEVLYGHWNHFAGRLSSDNVFLRSDAMFVLANLATIDRGGKFEKVFDRCYSQLNDKSMIAAANLARMSGRIALAKPRLQTKIINRLLNIDETRHSKECKNIIKGKAIDSFGEFFGGASEANQKKIIQFARKQLKNPRSGTRKRAERFLRKWG
jgi:hypothetical protein